MEYNQYNKASRDQLLMAYDAAKNNVPFEKFFAETFSPKKPKSELSEAEIFKNLRDEMFAKYGEMPDSVPLIREMRAEN